MLHLFASNALELLFERFLQLTHDASLSPLAASQTVVGNQGVGIWLTQQQALRQGVSANQQFPLPGRFVGDLIEAHFEVDSRLEKAQLQWLIYALLPELSHKPGFAPVAHYLSQSQAELQHLQLAEKIADVFDQYLVYRPDLLQAWEQGQTRVEHTHESWQAELWRAIIEQVGHNHRANLTLQLVEKGHRQQLLKKALPEQLVIFNPGAMAPVHLQVFEALAQQVPVHYLFQNPCCDHYWLDAQPPKRLAKRHNQWLARGGDSDEGYFDAGNPLLASFGQQGKQQLRCLYDLPTLEEDYLTLEIERADSLLSQIQMDIAEQRPAGPREGLCFTAAEDASLRIHSCHSPMRELQVLHDAILQAIEQEQLAPQDVLVMVPDIDRYAPLIDAVFSAVPEARRLPWTVADRTLEHTHALYATLLQLLMLGQSRFTVSEVLGCLSVPSIARRYDLGQTPLAPIEHWLHRAGVRWGLDAEQRKHTDQYPEQDDTWAQGLQRLFYGYAVGADSALIHRIYPYPDMAAGGDGESLGQLSRLLQDLRRYAAALREAQPLALWQQTLHSLIETFVHPEEGDEGVLLNLRQAAQQLQEHAQQAGVGEQLFSADVYTDLLRQSLNLSHTDQAFMRGGVTFCSTTPMRALPFRMIAMLGLNDGEFPRQQFPPSFDIMAAAPRLGDRSRREDDRYVFLEALLAASERLHLSYVGRSQRDNSERQASTLVAELRDYIDACKYLDQPSAALAIEHPLQPFDARNFAAGPTQSYASEWCPQAPERAVPAFEHPSATAAAPTADSEYALELSEWLGFWRDPILAYAQHMGLDWRQEEAQVLDEELFSPNALQSYQLRDQCLQWLLQEPHLSPQTLEQRLRQSALLPHGVLGQDWLDEQLAQIQPLGEALRQRGAERLTPHWLSVSLEQGQWQGQLMLAEQGLLSWHVSPAKPKHQWRLWLQHLLLCAQGSAPTERTEFLWIGKDGGEPQVLHVPALSREVASAQLKDLYACFEQGQQMPLSFTPALADAWLQKGRLAAAEVWQLLSTQMPYRALVPQAFPEEAIRNWAERLYAPMLSHLHAGVSGVSDEATE